MANSVKARQNIFIETFGVMLGYIPLGMTYGVLYAQLDLPLIYGLLASLLIFAGAGQFLLVALLSAKAGVYEIAISSFLLNLRHFFYTLSLLPALKKFGIKKHYIIFGLTDETYALLKTREYSDEDRFFKITLLNQAYWVAGSAIGLYGAGFITIDYSGIEFSLTALFVVLSLNLYLHQKNKDPFLLGLIIGVVALVFFPARQMLVLALSCAVVVMLIDAKLRGQKDE